VLITQTLAAGVFGTVLFTRVGGGIFSKAVDVGFFIHAEKV